MAKGSITLALKRALHQLIWVYSKWLLLLVSVVYLLSGIYKIERDAIGVLTRFGKIADPGVPPGLHYKLPWPIDKIDILPVKQVKTLVIRDFSSEYMINEGGKSHVFFIDTNLEPYCITGDNNIIAITLALKYTIYDPVKYLYRVKHPEYLVERNAAHVIVRNIAHLKIDEILTFGKKQLEFNLQKSLIEDLEKYETGIRLSFLEVKEIKPPINVQDAFDRVINAVVEKKKALNQAQGYYNRIVPEARSEANRIIQEAKAYKQEKILTAEGETSRFLSRLEGYKQNPSAHKTKLYLEFIRSVYPQLKEIRAIDGRTGKDTIFVPIKNK
jgi:membrane protease subunit HflK